MTIHHHMMSIIPGIDTMNKVTASWNIVSTDIPLPNGEYTPNDLAYQVCKRLKTEKCVLLDIIVYDKDPNENLDKIQIFVTRSNAYGYGWEFRDKHGRRYSEDQLFISQFPSISHIDGVLYVSKSQLNFNGLCR